MSSNVDAEAGNSGPLINNNVKGITKFGSNNQSIYDTKAFRLFSVIMYVCLVSGIGFLFALYHFFFWDSTMPPVAKVHGHEVY